jgi:phosphoribosylanthranilate isomerase
VSAGSELFVKICGLRNASSAQVAVESGADALGFILAPSQRQISPEAIAVIRAELARKHDHLPTLVGVTVNARPESIARDVEIAGLDLVQLAGEEDPAVLAEIDVPVIKALRFRAEVSLDEALREVDAWLSAPKAAARVLVEGHAAGSYGGTGTRADWGFVSRIAERYPVVLAGGLTPDNVSEAIAVARPAGVDVSSGVETDGQKDSGKIRDFVGRSRMNAVSRWPIN